MRSHFAIGVCFVVLSHRFGGPRKSCIHCFQHSERIVTYLVILKKIQSKRIFQAIGTILLCCTGNWKTQNSSPAVRSMKRRWCVGMEGVNVLSQTRHTQAPHTSPIRLNRFPAWSWGLLSHAGAVRIVSGTVPSHAPDGQVGCPTVVCFLFTKSLWCLP